MYICTVHVCVCIVLTLSLLCSERKAQLIIASNISVNVFEADAASDNTNLNSLSRSLPVVARSIDIDYTQQILYWISETDGVSNGVGVAGWAGRAKEILQ